VVNKSLLHLAALDYAAKGVPVFPCRAKGKQPATTHGFEDRTTDTTQIDKWWTNNPDFNIGIVPADQGYTVIDLDIGKDLTIWTEEYDWQMPATFTVQTPSGGLHLYFIGTSRPSASKIAPGVDVRSERSYVLAPPSYVEYEDGTANTYEVLDDTVAPVDLPECLIEAMASKPVERKKATGDDLDTEANISRARVYLLERAPLAIEGEGGDTTTYTVAACVRDYGISENACCGLMAHYWNDRCSPPWDDDDLEEKVAHAYKYPQNEIGSRAVPQAQVDKWSALQAANPPPPDTEEGISAPHTENRTSRFKRVRYASYRGKPEPTYWDPKNKVLPRQPGGATVIIYGDYGSHKTNVTLTMIFEAVFGQGAKAVFAAGEGAYGVGRQRIPAHCRARGIAEEELDNRFEGVEEVPLFASPADVKEFMEEQADFKPDIIVLDTFATAISGTDENSSEAAQFLTGNGPVGWMKREFGATVILPAHAGKDRSRGIRGNSGFGGNADVVLAIDTHKDKVKGDLIKITVEKMRDGEDGRCVYYAVAPHAVPVPVQIDEATYKARLAAGSKGAENADGYAASAKAALEEAGAFTWKRGMTDATLAEQMAGPRPHSDSDAYDEWQDRANRIEVALRKGVSRGGAYTGLHAVSKSHEGAKPERRWFCRPN
jgi:hypothetical protein